MLLYLERRGKKNYGRYTLVHFSPTPATIPRLHHAAGGFPLCVKATTPQEPFCRAPRSRTALRPDERAGCCLLHAEPRQCLASYGLPLAAIPSMC